MLTNSGAHRIDDRLGCVIRISKDGIKSHAKHGEALSRVQEPSPIEILQRVNLPPRRPFWSYDLGGENFEPCMIDPSYCDIIHKSRRMRFPK